MVHSAILVILAKGLVHWAYVVYVERTRADPSTLDVHLVRRAYAIKPQTLTFRVCSIYKHRYHLISHSLIILHLRKHPS